MNIYDIKVQDMQGNSVNLSDYKGKVLLVVNTATECGFTPQYADLQALFAKYNSRGLEILDFPCDQFGHQAPGSNQEIATFCTGRFGVTFKQFAKLEVNGNNQSELFAYLKSKQSFKGFDLNNERGRFMDEMFKKINPDYAQSADIKWNFTKFLIDRRGEVVARFEPTEEIARIESAIKSVL